MWQNIIAFMIIGAAILATIFYFVKMVLDWRRRSQQSAKSCHEAPKKS